MRRACVGILLCIVLAFVVSVLSNATPTVAQPKSIPKKVAVLIGVNGYANRPFKNLEFAERDMLELEKTLKAAGFKVIVLLGSAIGEAEASRENIAAVLLNKDEANKRYAFRDLTDPNDVILVAFSGHGEQIETLEDDGSGKKEKREVPFFCPKRAETGKPSTQVNLNEILRILDSGKPKSLLLVDACRSYAENREGTRGAAIDRKQIRLLRENVGVMFACSDRQQALEHKDAGGGHGLFFYSVLEAFRNAPKDRDGDVNWENMVPVIRDHLGTQVTKLFPKLPERDIQKPQASGTFNDKVVLVPRGVAAAEPRPGEEREFEIATGVKMRFCWVPAGKATLGSPKEEKGRDDDDDDETEHEFTTKGFWLGKYEVTQAEYEAVVGANPSFFSKNGDGKEKVAGLETSRFPVENVSWEDCQGFLKKCSLKSLRLPQEDEWEYAARGGKGNTTAFYWGDALNGDKANCDGDYPYGTATKGPYLARTSEVGSYAKAAPHPWGLGDMVGNVWEWCDNWHDSEQKSRVLRGGSWSYDPVFCRVAGRSGLAPVYRNYCGFRVCFRMD